MLKASFDRAEDGLLTLAAPASFDAVAGSVQSPFSALPVRFNVIDCRDLPCPPGALVIDDLKLE
ncbi:MAG TPA: hypothetical protein VHW01_28760 [Polyangiaceae bacterium]|jgi:hypothetical protein|nr:hypothetical protein [Polyangiaceae bacterium]